MAINQSIQTSGQICAKGIFEANDKMHFNADWAAIFDKLIITLCECTAVVNNYIILLITDDAFISAYF